MAYGPFSGTEPGKKTQAPSKMLILDGETSITSRMERLFPSKEIQLVVKPDIGRVTDRLRSDRFALLLVTCPALKRAGIQSPKSLDRRLDVNARPPLVVLGSARDTHSRRAASEVEDCWYAGLPISDAELESVVREALNTGDVNSDRRATEDVGESELLLGRSNAMQAVFRQIEVVAKTEAPVLLVGQTGTGKDVVARVLHRKSGRVQGPYIPVNLGALPSELVGSELFGHEKGAFTSALDRRQGKFELAQDGTLFLDEIDSMSKKVQVSLLRLLEESQFYRLGGQEPVRTNARLIAAANRPLRAAVKDGVFREDLFYRLDVFSIELPPLRERPGDISLLSSHFLKRYCREFEKDILGFSPECAGVLESYSWPGNVRELQNVIQRAALVCTEDMLLPEHLPGRFQANRSGPMQVTFDIGTPLVEVERRMIEGALALSHNNRKRAAEILGICRRSLYTKLDKHGMR
jgi:DNA-binding NtrC family response regulator